MKHHFLIYGFAVAFLVGQTMGGRSVPSVDWWVAPEGSTQSTGSAAQPLASLSGAFDRWNASRSGATPQPKAPLRLILRGGTYYLTQPITIKSHLSETDSLPITLEAAPGERPILCGGVKISHWQPTTSNPFALPALARGRVWEANIPRREGQILSFRQLWVNGSKAVRARQPNAGALARLVAWDKTKQIATIPGGMISASQPLPGLEMVIDQVWEIASLRVQTLAPQGSNLQVRFRQPESRLEFAHPWPPVIVKTNYSAPFYLVNALEFLDSPGEWFEDPAAGKIYYWPRTGEDLNQATVIAPTVETLVTAIGSATAPVRNLHFKGITFVNTTWMRPSEMGHVPLQTGMYLLDAHKLTPKGTHYHPKLDNVAWIGRPPAAVYLEYCTQVTFEGCTFAHLAAAGLDIGAGCREVTVQGCAFRDIGGNGLQLGMFSDPLVETHMPYNPSDDRDVCASIHVRNNLIADCGTEDWGCSGIAAGYVRNTTIAHNELHSLPYTGISLGWGWTKQANAMRDNAIVANDVHHVGLLLGDLGGIYTLSAQPGTLVAENVVADIRPSAYVPDPAHWFYLYADEGSAGITFRDNWCPADKFLKNANGPGNIWTNNGPTVSVAIKSAAGLESNYEYLLK